MKYKALLTGKNNSVIDDFFVQMSENFESITTSARYEDIMRHIKIFRPDIFVYCIYNESKDTFNRMTSLKSRLLAENIPFILIGLKEDCVEFERVAINVADMILEKPLNAGTIEEKLLMFIESYNPKMDLKKSIFPKAEKAPVPDSSNILGGNYNRSKITPAQPPVQQNQTIPKHLESLIRRHILVVDDNPLMLRSIKELLKNKYDVATAINGKIALKFLETKTTDLILLDFEMPELNGPAVLERLRANNLTKDIPVVFLTGITERNKIQEALKMKPQGYLLKPIDNEKLMAAISKYIN